MKTNMRGFLAGIVLLIAAIGFIVYGLSSRQYDAVISGLVIGTFFTIVVWITRRPGRKPNPKVMLASYVIGFFAPVLALHFLGLKVLANIDVVVSGFLLPVILLLLVATLVIAKRTPGYWKQ